MSEKTIDVHIDKMTCGSCVYKVESEVSEIPGVSSAKVDLTSKSGKFTFDSSKLSGEDIVKKINELGFVAKLVLN